MEVIAKIKYYVLKKLKLQKKKKNCYDIHNIIKQNTNWTTTSYKKQTLVML